MTILNDMEIRERCLEVTHGVNDGGRTTRYLCKHGDRWYTKEGATLRPNDFALIKDHIFELAEEFKHYHRHQLAPMITPFDPTQVRTRRVRDCEKNSAEKIISYGTSSMGYDVRLSREFKIFTNVYGAVIDPLNMPDNAYVDHVGDYVVIPPNSYILGSTIETFDVPRDILGVCLGKSTYARCAAIVNVTPIEPGFCGQVVIEVANLSTLPLKIYAGMGIAQFLFLKGNPCETSYADRGGKYQNQTGIQTALV
jgi:dCTP deaminase